MDLERWRAVSAAMAIAAATSVPAAGGERECSVETRLQWVDVERLAGFAYPAMAREAEHILAEHGVCAELSRVSPRSVRANGEIGVILLRSMAGSGAGRHVMGATRSHQPGNATVWVYLEDVASAVGLAGRGLESGSGLDRAVFGRALGRVVAHEIVHTLLPERPHDSAGLMSASLGRHELTTFALRTHPGLLADVRRAGRNRLAENTHDRPQGDGAHRLGH
jgi:hypothetical protein